MIIFVMRVLRWLLSGVAAAGIGLVVYQPVKMIQESRLRDAAVAWPGVAGRILDTEIVPDVGKRTYYRVAITYDYIVGGQHFIRDSIWLTGRVVFLSGESARRFLDSYPQRSGVTVYYDPADPSDATLIREGTGMNDWRMLEYGIALLIGAALMWSIPRMDWTLKRKS